MPVELQFERINNRDDQTQIKDTVLAALHYPDEHWKVTVVAFRSGHAYVIDVRGPGVRWGDCYQVQPNMLSDIKKHVERLASYCVAAGLSEESSQHTAAILSLPDNGNTLVDLDSRRAGE